MTTPDIADLWERLHDALANGTPGPWVELETESSVDLKGCEGWQDIGTTDGRVLAVALGYARFPCDDKEGEANAAFIALSREAVPVLLDTLERQAAEIERLRGALGAKADEGMLVLETLAKMTPDRAHRHVKEGLTLARKARAALTGEDA
jgi:hypothetical protein